MTKMILGQRMNRTRLTGPLILDIPAYLRLKIKKRPTKQVREGFSYLLCLHSETTSLEVVLLILLLYFNRPVVGIFQLAALHTCYGVI